MPMPIIDDRLFSKDLSLAHRLLCCDYIFQVTVTIVRGIYLLL